MQIYRCLVVFAYRWLVIVFPSLLWAANAVCSAIIIYITSTLRRDALLSVDQLSPFLTAFLALTLVTNLLTTGACSCSPFPSFCALTQNNRSDCLAHLARRPRDVKALLAHRQHRQAQTLAPIARDPYHRRVRPALHDLCAHHLWHRAGREQRHLRCVRRREHRLPLLTSIIGNLTGFCVLTQMVVVVGISFNLIIIRVDQGTAVGDCDTYASSSASSSGADRNAALPLHFRTCNTAATDMIATRDSGAAAPTVMTSAGVEVIVAGVGAGEGVCVGGAAQEEGKDAAMASVEEDVGKSGWVDAGM